VELEGFVVVKSSIFEGYLKKRRVALKFHADREVVNFRIL
jgi:hypothetical protein